MINSSYLVHFSPVIPHAGGRTPAHCLRFAHPAEPDWRLEARKFENLHLGMEWNAMEWNDGMAWDDVGWNEMEWNGPVW